MDLPRVLPNSYIPNRVVSGWAKTGYHYHKIRQKAVIPQLLSLFVNGRSSRGACGELTMFQNLIMPQQALSCIMG
jgi:hypothetical protein